MIGSNANCLDGNHTDQNPSIHEHIKNDTSEVPVDTTSRQVETSAKPDPKLGTLWVSKPAVCGHGLRDIWERATQLGSKLRGQL
mmetsp:Transcript_4308/g.12232  ORF Transcript_4308/g.12232 Transcript_4308/m.12232 type:complete len:84 (-) Transcript_4308:1296-1547(-)